MCSGVESNQFLDLLFVFLHHSRVLMLLKAFLELLVLTHSQLLFFNLSELLVKDFQRLYVRGPTSATQNP